jgi:hypothetical protein
VNSMYEYLDVPCRGPVSPLTLRLQFISAFKFTFHCVGRISAS